MPVRHSRKCRVLTRKLRDYGSTPDGFLDQGLFRGFPQRDFNRFPNISEDLISPHRVKKELRWENRRTGGPELFSQRRSGFLSIRTRRLGSPGKLITGRLMLTFVQVEPPPI